MKLFNRNRSGRQARRGLPLRYTSPAGQVCTLYENMLQQPHLLIAGATGSGKSVVINALIYTALYKFPCPDADGVQFILIDPKRVELSQYKRLPHTLCYASEPDAMREALSYAMQLCEDRYKQMQRAGVRKYPGGDIYVIIDEFADLMTTQKRLIMPVVQRLAQIGRAAKVHIILATQTPIAKVLPTEIKCNFDARVALRTRSAQDSRNILGVACCETLPRYGFAYYMRPEGHYKTPIHMYSEAETAGRVKWWIDQARGPLHKLFNKRSA